MLHNFIDDPSLAPWTNKGMHYLNNLFASSSPKSFSCLQKDGRELFTYPCTYHCIASLPNWPCKILWPVWVFLTTPRIVPKGISLFYTIFQQNKIFSKTEQLRQWETDLGNKYTDDQWVLANRMTYKVTLCSALGPFHNCATIPPTLDIRVA